ncbi:UNKNOWN [Stylonychia lemnae]|uniref:Uncharacterized protein n=1 Tax=Stylonychia lemnae TaxID=5949 RepID=A0A078ANZ6_STYLE|nr:UNKNOWN [Stylonychia lemnae]|eukprot:CDW83032.1 UNKNOWN [Stylonychia lemnae]
MKDDDQISLINFRNYQIIKVIDSNYSHYRSYNKNGSLLNERIVNQEGNFYKFIDLQRDTVSAEIREMIIRLA